MGLFLLEVHKTGLRMTRMNGCALTIPAPLPWKTAGTRDDDRWVQHQVVDMHAGQRGRRERLGETLRIAVVES